MVHKKISTYMQMGFVLSLILNGFFVGFIVSGPSWQGPPIPDPAKRMYDAAQYLSPESKDKVIVILDKHTEEIDKDRREGMSSFKEIKDILTAEDIHPEKLDAVFNNMAQHHAEAGALIGGMLKEIAVVIPDNKERIEFFERALPPEPPFRGPPPK